MLLLATMAFGQAKEGVSPKTLWICYVNTRK